MRNVKSVGMLDKSLEKKLMSFERVYTIESTVIFKNREQPINVCFIGERLPLYSL